MQIQSLFIYILFKQHKNQKGTQSALQKTTETAKSETIKKNEDTVCVAFKALKISKSSKRILKQ